MEELATAIKSLGHNPNEEELSHIISKVGGNESLEFGEFLNQITKKMKVIFFF